MIRQWDALVIGAGPAGLRAASVIAESGLEVVLVDEQAFPGGQIYRHVTAPGAEERFAEAADYRDGTELVRRFRRSGAEYLPETTVWFLEQDRILASRGEEVLDLRARNVIIAVGAMERPVPFRGWTLPGVMNAGAGDILLKTAGLLPETPVVLAGSGPLLYLVASHLIRKGHPLAAVLDQTPPSNMLKAAPHLPAGLLGLPLLLRGLSMLNDVRKSGTPVYRDVSGIEAQGADRAFPSFPRGRRTRWKPRPCCTTAGSSRVRTWRTRWICPTIGMRASSAGPWPATAAAGRRGKACTSPGTAAAYAVPPSLG